MEGSMDWKKRMELPPSGLLLQTAIMRYFRMNK